MIVETHIKQLHIVKQEQVFATHADSKNDWAPSSETHWRKDTLDLSGFLGDVIIIQSSIRTDTVTTYT